jgi:hypothetical protein
MVATTPPPLEALQRHRYDRAMRRLVTWLVVSLGIAAIARRLRKRGRDEDAAAQTTVDDPAGELRQKLAESRSEPAAAAEPEPEPPVSPEATVDTRRADVHEQGRSTVDEMREADETSS